MIIIHLMVLMLVKNIVNDQLHVVIMAIVMIMVYVNVMKVIVVKIVIFVKIIIDWKMGNVLNVIVVIMGHVILVELVFVIIMLLMMDDEPCSKCVDNYYPETGDNICNTFCLASETCNSNGECNADGKCVCYLDDILGYYNGENCNNCLTNYYKDD